MTDEENDDEQLRWETEMSDQLGHAIHGLGSSVAILTNAIENCPKSLARADYWHIMEAKIALDALLDLADLETKLEAAAE